MFGYTVKEIVQGKPWAHPTHPLFVHFPTALYPVGLGLAGVSRLTADEAWQRAATVLLAVGLAAAVPAIVTGLLDWSGMVPSSSKRKRVTNHLLVQSVVQAVALGSFAALASGYGAVASVLQIGLLAVTCALLLWGNYLGGHLVYRDAMRVGGKPQPPRKKQSQSKDQG